MSLAPGHRLAHYEVISPIGKGGMGEVYRARDTKLGRDVAIKVLPEEFARDKERLERFEREARLLAQLNHSNIATLYGLEEHEGQQSLIMELVEGETLAERITKGRIPVDEALPLLKEIAEGLEAAHEKGVIHRDLKPANIKISPEGKPKILDFGLAKAFVGEGERADGSSQSPTLTKGTALGAIIGTAPYMSPEQARGKSVDKRSDIWTFGVVFYEMLTGQPMFYGDTTTDVLAAVISRDPDWSALPATTPSDVRSLLRRCLVSDPKKRLRDIGEARVTLEDVLAHPEGHEAPADSETSAGRVQRWRSVLLLMGSASLAALVAFFVGSSSSENLSENRSTVRAQIGLTPDVPLSFGMRQTLALSPDGSQLVVATQQEGVSQLYSRWLTEEIAVPIAGTEGGTGPFFSPDGRWIGFFAEGKLKKMPSDGGTPTELAAAPLAQGASFGPDGSVVFSPIHGEGIWKIAPDGATTEAITTVDRARGEAGHHWPHVLPDGEHALITVELRGKSYSEARIDLVSLENEDRRVLIEGGTDARYVPTTPTGRLVYWHDADLWAVPFDLPTLEITGAPVRAIREVMAGEPNGFAEYSFSRNGTLVYVGGRHPLEERSLVLFDRSGAALTLTAERRAFETPRVSPDGSRLAVSIEAANGSLWMYEFERRTLTRMTFDDENQRAAWSPETDRLVFASHPGGQSHQIHLAPIDGSADPEVLRDSDRLELPESWTANGNVLAFTRHEPGTGSDIWVMPMTGDRKPRVFLNSRFEEGEARFSFDGRWLAYQSDESGRAEVYVRAFPGPGGKRQISVGGGSEPRWGRGGRELYYRQGGAVMVVAVTAAGADFVASVPRRLFSVQVPDQSRELTTWDAMPDGNGFVMIQDHAAPRTDVSLVLGWFDELNQLDRGGR